MYTKIAPLFSCFFLKIPNVCIWNLVDFYAFPKYLQFNIDEISHQTGHGGKPGYRIADTGERMPDNTDFMQKTMVRVFLLLS